MRFEGKKRKKGYRASHNMYKTTCTTKGKIRNEIIERNGLRAVCAAPSSRKERNSAGFASHIHA